ncbi:MAG: NAD(P)H-dependent oxidoreductase subunit E [Oscillospiraceae bacterium]|nr:NAD(P)H-dependent oxidoreductase subunit E [Oscillospiraceae bacterium]
MERLNGESIKAINEIVAAHAGEPGPVIVMLHEVQDKIGYIPYEAMEAISKATGTSVADVFGVVNFYAQFTTEPKGKHVINVCLGTACYVKGAQKLVEIAEQVTGAKVNKTSADGMWSLDATRCLGACGLAPVVVIDGRVVGNCTPQKVEKEIKALIEAEKAEAGA